MMPSLEREASELWSQKQQKENHCNFLPKQSARYLRGGIDSERAERMMQTLRGSVGSCNQHQLRATYISRDSNFCSILSLVWFLQLVCTYLLPLTDEPLHLVHIKVKLFIILLLYRLCGENANMQIQTWCQKEQVHFESRPLWILLSHYHRH